MPRSARFTDSKPGSLRSGRRRAEVLHETNPSYRDRYGVELSCACQLSKGAEHPCPALLPKSCHPVHLTLLSLVGQFLPRAGAPPEYFCSQCVDDAIAEKGYVLGLPREEPVLASLSLESLGLL